MIPPPLPQLIKITGGYHARICHDITLPRVLCEHLVARVPQTFARFFAMHACAVRKVDA